MISGDVNVLGLLRFTQIPEAWVVFLHVVELSGYDGAQLPTLDMMSTYLDGYDLQMTHSDFWLCQQSFLSALHSKILRQRKRR